MVAGAGGLVGSAIVRRLQREGFSNLLTPPRAELELTDAARVDQYFEHHRPEAVVLAAAKVGGIVANNTYPGDFIRDNLLVQTLTIDAARRWETEKFVFLGSSCIYPKHAPQPISEDALMTGPLEPTNSAYALAKIAGLEMMQAYRKQFGLKGVSLMPTNLYGPGDNFDLETAHVLPALMRRFHEAKQEGRPSVTLWGSGKPRREFLHVDDLAAAVVLLLRVHEDPDPINVGCGEDHSIAELAELVREVVGYEGSIEYDRTKPDGTPRKLLDVSKINRLGWKPTIGLREGIESTYEWYRERRG